jgi:hypothetical protein
MGNTIYLNLLVIELSCLSNYSFMLRAGDFYLDIQCLLVRYSFVFDSFGASQAVYRNMWKEICLLLG